MRSTRSEPVAPSLDAERAFWRADHTIVAGVDEVGRGALAGPLVAAAVVFDACAGWDLRRLRTKLAAVRDSKALRPEIREALLGEITTCASALAIGIVEADELDQIGVGPANRVAMERAVLGLQETPHALLLDACVIDLGITQVGPIRGDASSLSIAAASIVAKVTRDQIMCNHHERDGRYHFAIHKGYGTSLHLEAIRTHGPGPIHRRSFTLIRPTDPVAVE
jgi:ribonuclease HII